MNSTSETEPYFLGIDLGGSCIKSVVVNANGKTLSTNPCPLKIGRWNGRTGSEIE